MGTESVVLCLYVNPRGVSVNPSFRPSRPQPPVPADYICIDCLYTSIYTHRCMHISLDKSNPVVLFSFS